MITVHRFRQGERYFAVDGGSASVHELDDIAYDVLGVWLELEGIGANGQENSLGRGEPKPRGNSISLGDVLDGCQGLFAKYGEEEVKDAASDLMGLVEAGLLFHDDAYVQDWAQDGGVGYSLKALCLNVSHDCNLRCRYCFAGTGNFGGDRLNMPASVAQGAIDFLLANSEGRERVEVDFFGGEPLLNLPVVKTTVEYATSRAESMGKEIRFTLTTNGMLLDEETADYLDRTMFNIVLSLDGRRVVNDRLRIAPRGVKVYDTVLPRLKHMAKLRQERQYYVRGTYTAYNKDFFEDVRHLVEVGFDRVSVEPVVANPREPYALKLEDLEELFHQYDRLADYYVKMQQAGAGFEFYHFNLSLLEGQCLSKRLTGCGAGSEYLAITPNGDIYPCHQFVGQAEYLMGNIRDGQLSEGLREIFQTSHVLSKDECRKCWARFFCSGGCHANAVSVNNDIKQPDGLSCALLKKRLECSIYIQGCL
ncbi:MAG: thioether cross-link-forming SCIFF peptide maturase [Firmicutes bacterium]|nr:thioether cross-link-forming SCIFF peptide maturase [Bacillota bacterium]